MKKLLLLLMSANIGWAATPVANNLDFSNAAIQNIQNIGGRTTSSINLFSNNNQNVVLTAQGTGAVQLGSSPTAGTVFSNITSSTSALTFGLTGATNAGFVFTPSGTGQISLGAATNITAGNLTMSQNRSAQSVTASILNSNASNTASGANLALTTMTGGGNPFISFNILSSGQQWSMGIDNTHSSTDFQIYPAATLNNSPAPAFDLTTAGNVAFAGTISGQDGSFTSSGGIAGTISTTASAVVISSPATNATIMLTPKGNGNTQVGGNLNLVTAAAKINVPTGANASIGVTGAMAGSPGSVTVTSSNVTTSSLIFYVRKTGAGTLGQVSISAQSAGSFTLTSTSAETSTFNYWIIN